MLEISFGDRKTTQNVKTAAAMRTNLQTITFLARVIRKSRNNWDPTKKQTTGKMGQKICLKKPTRQLRGEVKTSLGANRI